MGSLKCVDASASQATERRRDQEL